MTDEVRAVLRNKRLLLLDFDGPICSLYDRTSARKVAAALIRLVPSPALRQRLTETSDPLDVLRITSALDADQAAVVERALIGFEVQAAASAAPTPGARSLVVAAKRSGLKVGVVSNNSEPAIHRYLEGAGMERHLDSIVGRPLGKPEEMKPAPTLLLRACARVEVGADRALFVGDSVSDVVAAHMAEMPCVGYANKPGKRLRLQKTRADAVIDSIADLVAGMS